MYNICFTVFFCPCCNIAYVVLCCVRPATAAATPRCTLLPPSLVARRLGDEVRRGGVHLLTTDGPSRHYVQRGLPPPAPPTPPTHPTARPSRAAPAHTPQRNVFAQALHVDVSAHLLRPQLRRLERTAEKELAVGATESNQR